MSQDKKLLHINEVNFSPCNDDPVQRCIYVALVVDELTYWGRVTQIYVSKLTIIGSDNGLSPGRRQAIIWTNAGLWVIGTLGTNFSEIFIKIHTFSFMKMHLKMSSGKWRPFCLGLNCLKWLQHKPCYVNWTGEGRQRGRDHMRKDGNYLKNKWLIVIL